MKNYIVVIILGIVILIFASLFIYYYHSYIQCYEVCPRLQALKEQYDHHNSLPIGTVLPIMMSKKNLNYLDGWVLCDGKSYPEDHPIWKNQEEDYKLFSLLNGNQDFVPDMIGSSPLIATCEVDEGKIGKAIHKNLTNEEINQYYQVQVQVPPHSHWLKEYVFSPISICKSSNQKALTHINIQYNKSDPPEFAMESIQNINCSVPWYGVNYIIKLREPDESKMTHMTAITLPSLSIMCFQRNQKNYSIVNSNWSILSPKNEKTLSFQHPLTIFDTSLASYMTSANYNDKFHFPLIGSISFFINKDNLPKHTHPCPQITKKMNSLNTRIKSCQNGYKTSYEQTEKKIETTKTGKLVNYTIPVGNITPLEIIFTNHNETLSLLPLGSIVAIPFHPSGSRIIPTSLNDGKLLLCDGSEINPRYKNLIQLLSEIPGLQKHIYKNNRLQETITYTPNFVWKGSYLVGRSYEDRGVFNTFGHISLQSMTQKELLNQQLENLKHTHDYPFYKGAFENIGDKIKDGSKIAESPIVYGTGETEVNGSGKPFSTLRRSFLVSYYIVAGPSSSTPTPSIPKPTPTPSIPTPTPSIPKPTPTPSIPKPTPSMPKPTPSVPKPTPTPSSTKINNLLNKSNDYRLKHQVGNLSLDEDLTQKAQEFATQLAQNKEFHHTPSPSGQLPYGQNLWWTNQPNPNVTNAIVDWYDESKNYDYNHPPSTPEQFEQNNTGHFTQLVWKNTTKVGFGIATNPSYGTIVVANYLPPGNVLGQFSQNVFPAQT